jgi:hypothetical protein
MTTDLIDNFYNLCVSTVQPEGFPLQHAMALDNDNGVTVYALDLNPTQIYLTMLQQRLERDPTEMVFALDRFAGANQGTTLGDLLAGHYYKKGDGWTPFIIEYRYEPRLIKPINWGNLFWNNMLRDEMRNGISLFADRVVGARRKDRVKPS